MQNLHHLKEEMTNTGVVVIDDIVDTDTIFNLRLELEAAIEEDSASRGPVFDAGMVHNCMMRGKAMCSLIENKKLNDVIDALFTPYAIIYAYQSSSLYPGSGNYGSRIHVDCPRFIPNYITNLGAIIALDDFTHDNGGTYYLPGSHKNESLPEQSFFYENAKQLSCNKGALILFNGRLVHAAGVNRTDTARHALTINYCRPYMRQRFDIPRLISTEQLRQFNDIGKRRIGMDVRMPTSLDEFYLPSDKRFYKPGQE